jgi:hypothetical protein
MPKGTVAPGKTLPPLVVPTRGLTRDAGSGWLARADGEADIVAIRMAIGMAAMSTRVKAELWAACMQVRVRHV